MPSEAKSFATFVCEYQDGHVPRGKHIHLHKAVILGQVAMYRRVRNPLRLELFVHKRAA